MTVDQLAEYVRLNGVDAVVQDGALMVVDHRYSDETGDQRTWIELEADYVTVHLWLGY